jgi:hypothetical protein
MEREFEDHHGSMSIEDREFMVRQTTHIHQREDRHFEMPLPLKKASVLPDNHQLVYQCLQSLKRKCAQNPEYAEAYSSYMNNMISKGFAECAPCGTKTDKVWYVPHHGVYHPKKPKKL